jgi:hypothetical protein
MLDVLVNMGWMIYKSPLSSAGHPLANSKADTK